MVLPLNFFDDDQCLAESDFDDVVLWRGEELPALVVSRGESADYVMAGEKARRRIVVQLRRSLFLEAVPAVGDVFTFAAAVYRVKGRKPDAVLWEFDCEERDS